MSATTIVVFGVGSDASVEQWDGCRATHGITLRWFLPDLDFPPLGFDVHRVAIPPLCQQGLDLCVGLGLKDVRGESLCGHRLRRQHDAGVGRQVHVQEWCRQAVSRRRLSCQHRSSGTTALRHRARAASCAHRLRGKSRTSEGWCDGEPVHPEGRLPQLCSGSAEEAASARRRGTKVIGRHVQALVRSMPLSAVVSSTVPIA
jgi:hypothetical protein